MIRRAGSSTRHGFGPSKGMIRGGLDFIDEPRQGVRPARLVVSPTRGPGPTTRAGQSPDDTTVLTTVDRGQGRSESRSPGPPVDHSHPCSLVVQAEKNRAGKNRGDAG